MNHQISTACVSNLLRPHMDIRTTGTRDAADLCAAVVVVVVVVIVKPVVMYSALSLINNIIIYIIYNI